MTCGRKNTYFFFSEFTETLFVYLGTINKLLMELPTELKSQMHVKYRSIALFAD